MQKIEYTWYMAFHVSIYVTKVLTNFTMNGTKAF